MTTTIVFAAAEEYLRSQDMSYATALGGSSVQVSPNSSVLAVGQRGSTAQDTNTYDATWSASWNAFGKIATNRAYQGDPQVGDGSGIHYGKIGWEQSGIADDLSGATIDRVELRMANWHWYWNAGGTARFGTHDNESEPTGSSSTSGNFDRWTFHDWPKGQSSGDWVDLDANVGADIRDGNVAGITTGRTGAGNRDDYGYWYGHEAASSRIPRLRITFTTGNYRLYEALLEFPHSPNAGLNPVSGHVRLSNEETHGSTSRDVYLRSFDFATPGTGDWRTPSQLEGLTQRGRQNNLHLASAGELIRVPLEDPSELNSLPTLRWLLHTGRLLDEDTPDGEEVNDFFKTSAEGTSDDPALVFTQHTISALDRTLGAQVQLSDGAWAVLETNGGVYILSHHDGSTATQIKSATIPELDNTRGTQSMALTRDAEDNLYLFYVRNDLGDRIAGEAFTARNGTSWGGNSIVVFAVPEWQGVLNNIACAWHDQDTLVLFTGRSEARASGTDSAWILVDAQALRDDASTVVRASGSMANDFILPASDHGGFEQQRNETGSLLDTAAGDTTRGWVVCTTQGQPLAGRGELSLAQYVLNGNGDGFSVNDRQVGAQAWCTKDADAKARVLAVSGSECVVVSADDTDGITVCHWQYSGGFTLLARVTYTDEQVASMPTSPANTSTWDATYHPDRHEVWIWYVDDADDQRLMRTSVDLSSGQARQDEIEVTATLGTAGTTNHALRVHRSGTVNDQVLITAANDDAGTHSAIRVATAINLPPTQTTLDPRANFDAVNDVAFEWNFEDPNLPFDTQSAYQIQIEDDLGTVVHDTGKTLQDTRTYILSGSTLSNDATYQWRARTWDSEDEVSPWSEYGTFDTSSSGTLNIVDPAEDNPDGVNTSSYVFEWEVSGTTQVEYEVVVERVDTGAVLLDTGWVASSSMTHTVQNMESDVEYRVNITSRDGSQVTTNTANRRITPSYATPMAPQLTISGQEGYLLTEITNPVPAGDRPEVQFNRILRRPAGQGSYVEVGQAPPDGTFRDYDVRAGQRYEYIARGQA